MQNNYWKEQAFKLSAESVRLRAEADYWKACTLWVSLVALGALTSALFL